MCASTQAVRQAHKRKLGAHINVPLKNVCTYNFIHVDPNTGESWQSVAQKTFNVYTDFEQLKVTLIIVPLDM